MLEQQCFQVYLEKWQSDILSCGTVTGREFQKSGPAAERLLSPSRVSVRCTVYVVSQLIATFGGRYRSHADSRHGNTLEAGHVMLLIVDKSDQLEVNLLPIKQLMGKGRMFQF